MAEKDLGHQFPDRLTELTAISPLDGRYRKDVEDLAPHACEMALIQTRVEVESKYLIGLSDVGLIRSLAGRERDALANLGPNMTYAQVERVKQIEDTTRHDANGMIRSLREILSGTSLEDINEMTHFAITSEDINNLSYRLMLQRAKTNIVIPTLDQVVDKLAEDADRYKNLPMLGRTHGQPAVPTTLGKEYAIFATRLNTENRKLEKTPLTGKLDGAVGNYNAHAFSVPHIDWIMFSKKFVGDLGFRPNLFTTQINPYEDVIENFQALQRANGVVFDLDQDMWRYISDEWLAQEAVEGEVGSSTMPQKVNPRHFENSEGNEQMANGFLETMGRILSTSRLQRDLSDSTVIRNTGVGLAYGLLGYRNTLIGLGRSYPYREVIREYLHKDWTILSEGVQTFLKLNGIKDPYSMISNLTRGRRMGQSEWQDLVETLPVNNALKGTIRNLTPESYTGYAERLTDLAIGEIAESRKK